MPRGGSASERGRILRWQRGIAFYSPQEVSLLCRLQAGLGAAPRRAERSGSAARRRGRSGEEARTRAGLCRLVSEKGQTETGTRGRAFGTHAVVHTLASTRCALVTARPLRLQDQRRAQEAKRREHLAKRERTEEAERHKSAEADAAFEGIIAAIATRLQPLIPMSPSPLLCCCCCWLLLPVIIVE